MPTRASLILLPASLLAVVSFVACENRSTLPVSPSANTAGAQLSDPGSAAAPPATAARPEGKERTITLFDACDPDTFNEALGAGTCVRSGGVRFDKFLEELGRHHSVGAWHFAPPQVNIQVGQVLVALNRGGETHTFTEVDEFGGGIVPMLNRLAGLTEVAPECNRLQPGDFIPAGGSSRETEEDSGVEKYQCCIHPWMRAEVRVGER